MSRPLCPSWLSVAAPAAVLAITAPAEAQRSCGSGALSVSGRVVDRNDDAPRPEVLLSVGEHCLTVTDVAGRFAVTGLPVAPAVIRAHGFGVCTEPTWVRPTAPGVVEVELRAIPMPNPLDDAQFILFHGSPWAPPTYEQFRCLAGNLEPLEPGAGDLVPTPDEVLARTLHHPAAQDALMIAAADHAVVPLMLHYGPLGEEPPAAPIAYGLGADRREGFLYVIVLQASHRRLLVQLGYHRARDASFVRTYVEDGLRLEWQREEESWDQGRLIDRWEAPPSDR